MIGYFLGQFKRKTREVGIAKAVLIAAAAATTMGLAPARRLWRHHVSRSFSFLGEDRLIHAILGNGRVFYIDVGANDPIRENNTYRFYLMGGHGINVEPNPDLHAKLLATRPRDISLNAGLGERAGRLRFYKFANDVLSTFDEQRARAAQATGAQQADIIDVDVLTLADVITRHVPDGRVDFLSVDAEGFDLQILRGNDWSRFRPKVVMVELETEGLHEFLTKQGYRLKMNTTWLGRAVNGIYVDDSV